jgi:peptidoglycan-associated lipoprotein
MRRIFFIFTFAMIFISFANAQNKKIEKANEYLNAGEYARALDLYTKIYPKLKEKSEKAEVSFNAGVCQRHLMNPQSAIMWFRKAILYKYQDPIVNLYIADAYKMKGLYDEAKKYYAEYKDLVPSDPRAENGLKACDLAVKWMNKPTRYAVLVLPTVNSRQNDFAPAMGSDTNTLYFTTTRTSASGDNMNYNSGQNFADIFFSSKDKKGSWSVPKPITGEINTQFDEGSCTLEPDGRTMYFTYCPVIENKNAGCKIYKSVYNGETWSQPEIVKTFSDTAISCGQPYLSPDGLTMYFVSDNPRGIGGKDIWKMTRKSKTSAKWSTPEILPSSINTKYDELYPAVDKNGNLYFASDGRIGMGGLDIFKATPNGKGGWTVENMKYPINSNGNDFGIFFINGEQKGYLSSSRNNGKGDDIFRFYLRPLDITLKGYVINDKNHAYLSDVKVEITGSDGSKKTVTTNSQGLFTVKLREDVDYIILTSKKTFLKATASVSTKGVKEDGKIFETEIYMKPAVGLVKIPNIRYDFNDTTLREESKAALDELVEILEINPSVVIELRANTDYRGTEEANLKLSQGRANSVIEYLVAHGIKRDRLVPKGMGESSPLVVDKLTAKKYPFLKAGDVLTEQFIKSLPTEEEQEICNELNRRTEFKVISADFKDNYEKFGD